MEWNHLLSKVRKSQDGWTLAELLIVVVIIAILAVMFLLVNWKRNLYRAQDAKRKTDLANIRRAFEEYYNDNECYPSATVLDNCGGSDLDPYMKRIPCDPTTRQPYKYQPDSDTNLCLGNRVCAKLQDHADPDIAAIGCHPVNGCGWGEYWNYCLATGTTVTASGFDPGVTIVATTAPTPTPNYTGTNACRPGIISGGTVVVDGTCNDVGDPASYGCPAAFSESNCQGLCGNPAYWCAY